MQFSIRLKQMIDGLPGHHRGSIMRICKATGLERHAVSALYHDRVSYIKMKTLASICDYLVEHAGVPRSEVLQRLFGLDVGDFWGMLVRPQHLRVCVGMRNLLDPPARRWVMASDAMLQGKLLHKISQSALQVTSRADEEAGAEQSANGAARQQLGSLEQELVMAPPDEGRCEDRIEQANKVYQWTNDFRGGEQALICLGSTKSNPVAELVYAHAFGMVPFRSVDSPEHHKGRGCPIFYLYRDGAPQPESCCGGMTLPGPKAGRRKAEAGIYIKTPDGKWACCACDDELHMCAVVFYVYHRHWRRLEMVIGGYSSLSTEQLAMALPTLDPAALSPVYESSALEVGATIIKFKFDRPRAGESIEPRERRPSIKPIRLDPDVIESQIVE